MPREPEPLRVPSFAAHASRGLIRDKRSRRKLMSISIAVAVLLIVIGTTVLERIVAARDHPLLFLLYWLACGWITVLVILLAFYDLLAIGREARGRSAALKREVTSTRRSETDRSG